MAALFLGPIGAAASRASIALRSGPPRMCAALIVAIVVISGTSTSLADDWSRWRGPTGDGHWKTGAVPAAFPKAFSPLWKRSLNPGYSGVVVAGGRVITMDRLPPESSEKSGKPETNQAKEQERVVCFDMHSGKTLWEYRYPATYGKLDYKKGPRSTPLVVGTRVFTLGAVGHLNCLDVASGRVLWSKDLVASEGAVLPEWGFSASPVLFREQVIVHAGLRPDGCYVSYDLASGKEVWRSGRDPLGYGTPVLFSRGGQTFMLGWTPQHVVCLDPKSGTQLWQVPYKVTYGVSIATPIVRDDIVLVSGYWEGTKAIRLGKVPTEVGLLWEENRFLRGLMSQPLYRQGLVYMLDKSHGLTCFRLDSGMKLWSDKNRLTPRGRNPQATLVWLGDSDHVLALNSDGQLIHARLSAHGYQELDRKPLVGPTWAHPAYANGCIFARDDEQIVCVRLPR